VKRLQAAGWSGAATDARDAHRSPLVRKWLPLNELPMRSRMAPRPGMPEFYREYLQRRWTEGYQSGRRLMAEVQALGYVYPMSASTQAWPNSWRRGAMRLPVDARR
jgi:hypothetical protein